MALMGKRSRSGSGGCSCFMNLSRCQSRRRGCSCRTPLMAAPVWVSWSMMTIQAYHQHPEPGEEARTGGITGHCHGTDLAAAAAMAHTVETESPLQVQDVEAEQEEESEGGGEEEDDALHRQSHFPLLLIMNESAKLSLSLARRAPNGCGERSKQDECTCVRTDTSHLLLSGT